MARHERVFRHEQAHKLDDPDRENWRDATLSVVPSVADGAYLCVDRRLSFPLEMPLLAAIALAPRRPRL